MRREVLSDFLQVLYDIFNGLLEVIVCEYHVFDILMVYGHGRVVLVKLVAYLDIGHALDLLHKVYSDLS